MSPTYESGRISLRQMYTRNAIYKDIKVWKIKRAFMIYLDIDLKK
jgi:hypothetical protein